MSPVTALLLIDLQEDYLARAGLQPSRERLVARIAEALAEARRQGGPVVHVHSRDAMPHRTAHPEVVEGTPGADPPAELRPVPGEPLLFKRFFSAFDAEGLEETLRERGVERVILAGVHIHACIQATALDAYARGFEVIVAEDLVGSYDPGHAAHSLDWLDGRAARVARSAMMTSAPRVWQHRDPTNWDQILGEVELIPTTAVAAHAEALAARQPSLAALPIEERARRLSLWHELLGAEREQWIDALIRDVGKPRIDAEGEVGYGLALLGHVAATLADAEEGNDRLVRYRPHGLVGLITPWNNPFAIPIAKLAPALGYGNAALWKPALAGSRLAGMLAASLEQAGLGEWMGLATGDAEAGQAVAGAAETAALSFTGSVTVGRQLIAQAGRKAMPIQAELGGSNAAIIDSGADLAAAAHDLAAAMFSFAGQRCTAIRRLIVLEPVLADFTDRLVTSVEALSVGCPADRATQVGPLIDKSGQQAFLDLAARAKRDGARLLAGGRAPADCPTHGCWMLPTLLTDLPADHVLLRDEVFGPMAAIVPARDIDAAIAIHNGTGLGLVGALFSNDPGVQRGFLDQAQAGLLSVNRARPPFSPAGPFLGWKASGHGPPEHGRWNRDFYARTQAIHRG